MIEFSMGSEPTYAHTIQIEINNRSGVKRKHLTDDEAADNCDAQRLPKLRTGSCAQGQWKRPKHGGHSGHENRAEAKNACLKDRVPGTLALSALGGKSE